MWAPKGAFFMACSQVAWRLKITGRNVFLLKYEYKEKLTLIFVTFFELKCNIRRISK